MTAEKKIAEIRRKMIPGSKLNENSETSSFADKEDIESVRKKMFPRSKLIKDQEVDEDVERVRQELFPRSKFAKIGTDSKAKAKIEKALEIAKNVIKRHEE